MTALAFPPGPGPLPAEARARIAAELRELSARQLLDRERRLADDVRAIEQLIDDLKTERSTWVERASGLPPEVIDYDFADWEREALRNLDHHRTAVGAVPARRRVGVTFLEYAGVKGVKQITVRRWADGETLPHSPGDPRNPWEHDAIPVTGKPGDRRRLVVLAGVKPTALTAAEWQALVGLLHTVPDGWSERAAFAPPVLEAAVLRRLGLTASDLDKPFSCPDMTTR